MRGALGDCKGDYLSGPDVRKRRGDIRKHELQLAAEQVLLPVFDTVEQFSVSLKKERDQWAEFIRRNNVMPD